MPFTSSKLREHAADFEEFIRTEVETMATALRAASRAADADALEAAYQKTRS